ncbi:hypothetical protein D3C83_85680 [compost metagenome]
MGGSITGNQGEPHCLIASIAVRRQCSTLASILCSSSWETTRSVSSGTMRKVPNSVAFCTMASKILPRGMAWARVIRYGNGRISFVS